MTNQAAFNYRYVLIALYRCSLYSKVRTVVHTTWLHSNQQSLDEKTSTGSRSHDFTSPNGYRIRPQKPKPFSLFIFIITNITMKCDDGITSAIGKRKSVLVYVCTVFCFIFLLNYQSSRNIRTLALARMIPENKEQVLLS